MAGTVVTPSPAGPRRPRPRGAGRRRRAAVIAVALVLAGCSAPAPAVDVADAPPAGAPPRDADLVDAGWPEVAAWIERENAAGRPVVVNLFASWCAPCRAEAPLLRAAASASPDIAFLGVDHQDVREDGEAFVREERLGFPTVYDRAGDVAAALGSRAMPTTAFFDTDGRMVSSVTGILTEPVLAQRLTELRALAAG